MTAEGPVVQVEIGSAVVVGAAVGFVALAWVRRWWSRNTRLVVTFPVLLLLVVPLLQEQLRSPAGQLGLPTAYADTETLLSGTHAGEPDRDSLDLIRTTGPGTLYVAFTCRGSGRVDMQLRLSSGALWVGQECVADETRELREWITLDKPEEFQVLWASAEQVRRNFIIQFMNAERERASA